MLELYVLWGVTKMGNIVPGVGIESTFLSIWASVLPITPSRLLDVTILLMQLFAREVSADYYTRPPRILSLLILTITYRQ